MENSNNNDQLRHNAECQNSEGKTEKFQAMIFKRRYLKGCLTRLDNVLNKQTQQVTQVNELKRLCDELLQRKPQFFAIQETIEEIDIQNVQDYEVERETFEEK